MRSKKGEMEFAQIWEIGQAVMLVVVFIALLFFVRDSINDTLLEKNYIARDNALLLSTVMAAPGNIFLSYPNRLSQFEFEYDIGNGYFKVKRPNEQLWTSYRYGADHNMDVNSFSSKHVDTLFYGKAANEVRIGITGIVSSKKIHCPNVSTTFFGWEARPSYFNTSMHFERIKSLMMAKSPGFTDVLDADLQDNIIIIEEMPGKGIKAYANHDSKASHKLGCKIANKLIDPINASYAAVVLVEPEGTMRQYLRDDKNAVLIKIGQDSDALKNDLKVVNAIYEGIEDFYEK